MANDLATGYIQILPSMGGVKTKIEQELGGAGESAGRKSGSMFGSAMGKYISAAALGTVLYKSITEGAALEQSLGGVETLFKDSFDTVVKNANNAWKTAGVSANDYMQQSTSFAASLLRSLDGDTTAAARYADMAITDMSDNANKFGTDITRLQMAYAGFSRGNYTMLDNLSLGFAGSQQGMKDLLAEAEKLSGVHYEFGNLADMYEAIHVVQEELGVTGTTAKEASSTLEGSFNSMKASLSNFLGNLSMRPELVQQSLSDLITSTTTFLVGNLVPAIGRVVQSIPVVIGSLMSGNFVGRIFNALGRFSDKLLTGATAFIDAGLGLAMKLADGIAKGLPAIIENVPRIVSNLANIINNNAPKLIGVGLYIIKTLGIGIVKAIPTLISNIPQILRAMVDAFMAFNWANLGRSVLVGMRTQMVGPVQSGLKGVVQSIKLKSSAIVSAFKAPFIKAANAVKSSVATIKRFFPLKVGKIFSNLKIPKISVSGGSAPFGIGGKGSLPKFHIKWNAKGGIFDSSSIIGYGVGEKGAEAILPLDTFWQKMDNIAASVQGGGQQTIIINLDGKVIGKSTVDYINGQTLQLNASPLMI